MFNRDKYNHGNWKFILIFAAVFFGVFASVSYAQNPDSLRITNAIGEPGQTVTLNVNLANPTQQAAGIIIVITRNAAQLHILPSNVHRAGRTEFMDSLTVNAGVFGDTVRIVIYDLTTRHPIPSGTGTILSLDFTIDSGAREADYPVVFTSRVDTTWNAYSPPQGTMVFPVLTNGFVRVTNAPSNNAPIFTPAVSSPQQAYVDELLQFVVRASDADGDNITLSATNLPNNSLFPTRNGTGSVSGQFSFTPSSSQDGHAYNVIFIAYDGFVEVRDTIVVNVGTPSNNQPPSIAAPSSQEVAEGAHLEFVVTATDPEGDFLTLSASNLPANAYFGGDDGYGTASDTFYFDPNYDQGGVTYTVTFTATDAGNHSASRQVSIDVINAINDFLEVAPLQGALPGSLNRTLVVDLRNPSPVIAVQFDLMYDPDIIDIRDVEPDSARAFDVQFWANMMEPGRYRVGLLSMSLDPIAGGVGPIFTFMVDVDGAAVAGPSAVAFDSASTVHDSTGVSVDALYDPGTYTVDILGDANLDGFISIGDCVAVLANILGRLDMNIRTFDAADYNRDADVRISDLQAIIYSIFGFVVSSPPPTSLAGSVEIIRDGILPGYARTVPVWMELNTEAAGVQFTIKYNPDDIMINDVEAGNMVSDMTLDYSNDQGVLKGVIYTLSLTEFGPASGELINLDVDVLNPNINPDQAVRLSDFELVSVDAQKLNVEVLGELPEKIALYQNYPNPFNMNTLISFDLTTSSAVNLSIYNVLGQMVKELYTGQLEPGSHQFTWDGTGANDDNVTSGIYFYRLQAESFDKTKKMLLVK